MKTCKTCKQRKSLSSFGVSSNGRTRLHCSDCRRAKSRTKTYGLSSDQQVEMLKNQRSQCMLCTTRISLNTCEVDHHHETGKVRGLLCRRCNHYLHIMETMGIAWMKRANQYLLGRYD